MGGVNCDVTPSFQVLSFDAVGHEMAFASFRRGAVAPLLKPECIIVVTCRFSVQVGLLLGIGLGLVFHFQEKMVSCSLTH